jgi:hypothetical protein
MELGMELGMEPGAEPGWALGGVPRVFVDATRDAAFAALRRRAVSSVFGRDRSMRATGGWAINVAHGATGRRTI